MPSTAADMMPPAYPAPLSRRVQAPEGTLPGLPVAKSRTGLEDRDSGAVSTAPAGAKPGSRFSSTGKASSSASVRTLGRTFVQVRQVTPDDKWAARCRG